VNSWALSMKNRIRYCFLKGASSKKNCMYLVTKKIHSGEGHRRFLLFFFKNHERRPDDTGLSTISRYWAALYTACHEDRWLERVQKRSQSFCALNKTRENRVRILNGRGAFLKKEHTDTYIRWISETRFEDKRWLVRNSQLQPQFRHWDSI